MRRVDGVLPSGVLSAKCHVAWTRSGRLVFSNKVRYLYHTILIPYLAALVLALPLVAVRKSRLRAARSGSCTASKLCEVGTIDAPRIRL